MPKCTVLMSDDMLLTLKDLAERRGSTRTQVLCDAIQAEKFFSDRVRQGSKILLRYPEGDVFEVIFPYDKK